MTKDAFFETNVQPAVMIVVADQLMRLHPEWLRYTDDTIRHLIRRMGTRRPADVEDVLQGILATTAHRHGGDA